MTHESKRKNGFSLMELLVVMGIMAVLIAIATNGVRYGILFSHDEQYKEEIVQYGQDLTQYYAEKGFYPFDQCPGSGGFDGTDTITTSATFMVSDPTYKTTNPSLAADISRIANAINKQLPAGSIGYCSSPQLSTGVGASSYVMFVKTGLVQVCHDANNKSYFAIGSGTYTDVSGNTKYFYNIPQDAGLSAIVSGGYASALVNCYKT